MFELFAYRMLLWAYLEFGRPQIGRNETIFDYFVAAQGPRKLSPKEFCELFANALDDSDMAIVWERVTRLCVTFCVAPDEQVGVLTEQRRANDDGRGMRDSVIPKRYRVGADWLTGDYAALQQCLTTLREQDEEAWLALMLSKTYYYLGRVGWEMACGSGEELIKRLREAAGSSLSFEFSVARTQQVQSNPMMGLYADSLNAAFGSWREYVAKRSGKPEPRNERIFRDVRETFLGPLTTDCYNSETSAMILTTVRLVDDYYTKHVYLPLTNPDRHAAASKYFGVATHERSCAAAP